MVQQIHRAFYRNKKRIRLLQAAMLFSLWVFVFSPGWVYFK